MIYLVIRSKKMVKRKVALVLLGLVVLATVAYLSLDKIPFIKNGEEAELADTLNYGEKDYDLMRAYYKSDTMIMSMLTEKILQGDSDAIKAGELLNTPYALRLNTKIEDSEIDAMIFAYYATKKVKDRFAEIEKTLPPKTSTDSIYSLMDSLESIRKQLKQD
jgi:hypothetical protein